MSRKPSQIHIVIGLGSGRCGTHSLAYLLNVQQDAEVTHERFEFNLCWTGADEQVEEFLEFCHRGTEQQLVGDVASSYLPYVEMILTRDPSVKFICLQRDRDATVSSFLQKTGVSNHWKAHRGWFWKCDPWDTCFPKYNTFSKKQSLRLYWDDYYEIAGELQRRYPDNFRVFPTEALNSASGQRDILGFIGIPEQRRQFCAGIRLNPTLLSHQSDTRKGERELLQHAVACLKSTGLPFWLDFGGLLGLVRDGAMIPWDQDFDFSTWLEDGTVAALCAAFPAEKFVVNNFVTDGRNKVLITPRQSWSSLSIDIMLYRKCGDRALLYLYDDDWKPLWIRGVIFLIECFRGNGFEQHYSNRSFLKFVNFLKILPYAIFTRSLQVLLPDNMRLRCTEFLETYLAMCRRIPLLYDHPAHFYENFQTGKLLDVEMPIPRDAEEYLEVLYGEDWRIPQQWDHWSDGVTWKGKRKGAFYLLPLINEFFIRHKDLQTLWKEQFRDSDVRSQHNIEK